MHRLVEVRNIAIFNKVECEELTEKVTFGPKFNKIKGLTSFRNVKGNIWPKIL